MPRWLGRGRYFHGFTSWVSAFGVVHRNGGRGDEPAAVRRLRDSAVWEGSTPRGRSCRVFPGPRSRHGARRRQHPPPRDAGAEPAPAGRACVSAVGLVGASGAVSVKPPIASVGRSITGHDKLDSANISTTAQVLMGTSRNVKRRRRRPANRVDRPSEGAAPESGGELSVTRPSEEGAGAWWDPPFLPPSRRPTLHDFRPDVGGPM